MVAQRLRHLLDAVGADQQRHRHHRLLRLTLGPLDVAPEQQVEGLVRPADLDVRRDRDRVVALQQRVEQLEQADRLVGREPLVEVVALQELGDLGDARQGQEPVHRHVEPLAVAPHLEPLRILIEHAARLLAVGRRVVLDRFAGEYRAGRRAPTRVAHARGVVTDDQDHPVTEVLELAQLLEDHDVPEVDVRRRRVDAELDAEWAILLGRHRQASLQGPLRLNGRNVAGQERGVGTGVRHGFDVRILGVSKRDPSAGGCRPSGASRIALPQDPGAPPTRAPGPPRFRAPSTP